MCIRDSINAEYMGERDAIVNRLGMKYHAPVVHFQKIFESATNRAPADYWIWDGIHPTYAGHQLMADEWVRAVQAWRSAKQQPRPQGVYGQTTMFALLCSSQKAHNPIQHMKHSINRRHFIKTAAVAGAAVSAFQFIPARALGGAGFVAPSKRITLGVIGLGIQGNGNMRNFLGHPEMQVVAVCDVHAPVSYTHLRAHETRHDLVCRLLLEKKKTTTIIQEMRP
eukprot:TRINITY_DN15061_c0_g1_i2.p2 TRINITY_DN15061_c0_g1~~TRINITY_DN15061_c0_g1_i2.p2  ORF type:complete len:224 (+),score=6.07 TRINITY_DN15061_c0_g1_i2:127-798(+)